MRYLPNLMIIFIWSTLSLIGCDSENEITQPMSYNFEHEIIFPKNVIAGMNIPIVLRQPDVNPRQNVKEFYLVSVDGRTETFLEMKRGRGSTIISIREPGDHLIELTNEIGKVVTGFNIHTFTDGEIGIKELSGILGDSNLSWDSTEVVHVTDDIYISEGDILTIGTGTIVLVSEKVNIFAEGEVHSYGTFESPIIFCAKDLPWGMI